MVSEKVNEVQALAGTLLSFFFFFFKYVRVSGFYGAYKFDFSNFKRPNWSERKIIQAG